MIAETLWLAMVSVRRNALRSVLTLLGIVIGVAAVIAMITVGSGTTQKIKDDIAKLGSNLLIVSPGNAGQPGQAQTVKRTFAGRDIEALRNGLPDARAVSAVAQTTMRVVSGTENERGVVIGADDRYFPARDWKLAAGRFFTEAEARAGVASCMIGQTLRSQFFGEGDPVGANVRLGKSQCRVVGLLEPKGFSSFGTDQDNIVIAPLKFFQRRVAGDNDIETIYISGADGADLALLKADVTDILRDMRRVRPGEDDDFSVRDLTQIADTMASTTRVMSGMLGAVAAVSLLVGGIGIMNIMLVSVTERTREIGIRLAIGAQEAHILVQFLVEATVLSAIGGLIGVALGLALALLAASLTGIPFDPSASVILLAVSFSALIGTVFGFFPALNGARLDPIVALRHE
jgi:putative ABC transport system permease protein